MKQIDINAIGAYGVNISANGEWMQGITPDKEFVLLNLLTGKLSKVAKSARKYQKLNGFSANAQRVVWQDSEERNKVFANIWKTADSPEYIGQYEIPIHSTETFTISPDSQTIVYAKAVGVSTSQIIFVAIEKTYESIELPLGTVNKISWCSDNSLVLNTMNQITRFNIDERKILSQIQFPPGFTSFDPVVSRNGEFAIAKHNLVDAFSATARIFLCDLTGEGKILKEIVVENDAISSAAIAEDNQSYAFCFKGKLQIFKQGEASPFREIPLENEPKGVNWKIALLTSHQAILHKEGQLMILDV